MKPNLTELINETKTFFEDEKEPGLATLNLLQESEEYRGMIARTTLIFGLMNPEITVVSPGILKLFAMAAALFSFELGKRYGKAEQTAEFLADLEKEEK